MYSQKAWRRLTVILAAIVLVTFPTAVRAGDPERTDSADRGMLLSDLATPSGGLRLGSKTPGTEEMGKLVGRAFFGVVMVVLAAVVLLMVYRSATGRRPGGVHQRNIRVLETAHLGAKRSLHLVCIGTRKLLVACSGDGMTLLADVTDAVEEGDETISPPARTGFAETLRRLLGASATRGESTS